MSRRRNTGLWALGLGACALCCLPLILPLIGVATGSVAAAWYWIGANAALVAAVASAMALTAVLAVRRHRQRNQTCEPAGTVQLVELSSRRPDGRS